jgi:hypothetical protein
LAARKRLIGTAPFAIRYSRIAWLGAPEQPSVSQRRTVRSSDVVDRDTGRRSLQHPPQDVVATHTLEARERICLGVFTRRGNADLVAGTEG